MNDEYKEVKERYSRTWQDWYYWPMDDETGRVEAKERLDSISKEINEFKRAHHDDE